MATLKQRLTEQNNVIITKLNLLNTKKEENSNKKQDLTSTSADHYPSVPAVKAEFANKVDKVTGKGLSDENYTAAEKQKLANLEGSKYRGTFPRVDQLPTTGNSAGSYADVDSGVGDPTVRYIWDNNDEEWIAQIGDSTRLTASQVKQLYESNPDTNAFTDADEENLDLNTAHRNAPHAPANAQKNSDITKGEIEAKLTGTITTHKHNATDINETAAKRFVSDTEKATWNAKATQAEIASAVAVVQNDLNTYRTDVVGEGPFPNYAQLLLDGLNF